MTLDPAIRDRIVLPAIVAPMFLVSGVELAIAACKAGLIGSLTRNHCRTDEEFEQQLIAVREALAIARDENDSDRIGPLAANVSINASRQERDAALKACARHGVDIVLTAGGDPTEAGHPHYYSRPLAMMAHFR